MNPKKEYDPLTHCVAGGLAGAVAAGITTPLDVIKTQWDNEKERYMRFLPFQ